MKKYGLVIALVVLTTMGCLKGQDDPVFPSPDLTIPVDESVTLQKAMPFPFGAAVNVGLLKNNTTYRNLVIKEYNSLTAENAMKFTQLHPSENVYTWADADYLVDFAQQNGKRVHGHTLIWYKNPPSWVLNYQGDAQAWDNLLKNHIQTVVSHFKGKVASWDVVNEAMADNGTLRDCIWLQKLGADYIAKSFIYAHQADPDALLFYNDFGHEYSTTKRTAIINMVNNLKQQGVPIDGIGLQMHTNYMQSDKNLADAINTAVATGLKVHIAELDISMNPNNIPDLTFSAGLAEQQKAKYEFIVKTYNAIPKNQQFGITTWNVSDADTWIRGEYNRPDWPLPFNDNYERKAAYQGILDGVK
ncbi:endo-1,4-beta-xylanase [Pedobacter sp. BS3]|uniref:endo-1,4-beta-xylanase n=1 Tax=Pedobacter sp. BS3 TaxID=2567937 RepID=UPI0011EC68EF|nr:endo-1,4-beta-xylanase [Pedobacter sp. BS3]TZF83281.1 endo-1,4-beta-xylanase [Pedobacter sp. BS3]